jgi:hypothetical protein
MSERDTRMPAATAAVVGLYNKPSVQERIISQNISTKLKDVDHAARRPLADVLAKKRRGWDGHARD